MKPNTLTTVIFRKFKDGDIIALFPYEIETGEGLVLSYMHIGQHGSADIGIIQETKLATNEEYKDLKKELENIGYNLEVKSKINYSRYADAYKTSKLNYQ